MYFVYQHFCSVHRMHNFIECSCCVMCNQPFILDEEEEDADFNFDDLFSTRRPKDIMGGVGSGMKSIVKGVAAGAATLVAAPVMGARKEGVKVCNFRRALMFNFRKAPD